MVMLFGMPISTILLMLAPVAVVFAYYLLVWAILGRDRPPGVIVPRWEPPQAYSSAGLRYLARLGNVDCRSLPATLLGLAAKGKLAIQADARGYVISRSAPPTLTMRDRLLLQLRQRGQCSFEYLADTLRITENEVRQFAASARAEGIAVTEQGRIITLPSAVMLHLEEDARGLTPDELAVFAVILGQQDEVVITEKANQLLHRATAALKRSLGEQFGTYFTHNLPYIAVGIALSLLAPFGVLQLFSVVPFPATPGQMLSAFLIIALVTSAPAMFTWTFRHAFLTTCNNLHHSDRWLLLAILAYLGYASYQMLHFLPAVSLVVCYLLIGVNLLFYHLMKNATAAGRKMLDDIAGLRLFLAVYPDEVRQAAEVPLHDIEQYHALLPYAYALDVEQQWAAQFTNKLEMTTLGFWDIPIKTEAQPVRNVCEIYPDYREENG